MESQQFCLRWNNHQSNMLEMFASLLATESLVDVTLACDGAKLKAHKVVLAACSPFFQDVFINNPCKHPIVILKDVSFEDLKAIIDFMYHGEVSVSQERLSSLLKCAETLKIKGLADMATKNQRVKQVTMPPDEKIGSFPAINDVGIVPMTNKNSMISSLFPARRRRGRPAKMDFQNEALNDDDTETGGQTEIPDETTEFAGPTETFNDSQMELQEQDKQPLDLLTVDESQMIVAKTEKSLAEHYQDEYLDLEHDSSFEDQFEESLTDSGSTSHLNTNDGDPPDGKIISGNEALKSSDKHEGRPRRRRRLWTDADMRAAVGAVLHAGWTTYAASSQYGIPRRTLRYYIEKVKMS